MNPYKRLQKYSKLKLHHYDNVMSPPTAPDHDAFQWVIQGPCDSARPPVKQRLLGVLENDGSQTLPKQIVQDL